MIKAILWDNDGVLVDTERFFFQATRETLKSVGVDLSKEQFIEFSLVKGYGLWEYLRESGADAEKTEATRLKRNRRYSELLAAEDTLIGGVKETLSSLHGKYVMGVVTSSQREHFDIIHRNTELLPYFDFIITSDECSQTKPHPEPYLKGLAKAGVTPQECVAVEDSARGLVAANRAGMRCLMIPHALADPSTYKGDFLLLTSVRDVEKTLASMALR